MFDAIRKRRLQSKAEQHREGLLAVREHILGTISDSVLALGLRGNDPFDLLPEILTIIEPDTPFHEIPSDLSSWWVIGPDKFQRCCLVSKAGQEPQLCYYPDVKAILKPAPNTV